MAPPGIGRLRLASLASTTAIALCVPAATAAATTAAATAWTSQGSQTAPITLTGTVLDARGERLSGKRILAPSATPPVAGAVITVNGRPVARTGASGAFSIVYPDPADGPITITVSASGYGTYRLAGVRPSQDGATLTVQLIRSAQSMTARASSRISAATEGGQSSAALGGLLPREARTDAADSSQSGNCGGYSSDTTPPSTIAVLEYSEHTGSGAPVAGTETGVVDVPFEDYVENVLPNEWIPSWESAALEAGAMAVKTYAWYWVNGWRGGSYDGTCYNVDDSIDYQRYVPGSNSDGTDAAVDATWNEALTENGSIFQAGYQATLTDNSSENCGAGVSIYPNTLSQWGSENCALDGDSWQTVLGTYYPQAAVSDISSAGPDSSSSTDGSDGTDSSSSTDSSDGSDS